MVAFSFQSRFVAPILAGSKRQTIRRPRKDGRQHAKLNDTLQLYTAMRTRHCRLIGTAVCQTVMPIRLDLVADVVALPGRMREGRSALDAFAKADGFEDWAALKAFWRQQHPGVDFFEGSLITWACFELPGAAPVAFEEPSVRKLYVSPAFDAALQRRAQYGRRR